MRLALSVCFPDPRHQEQGNRQSTTRGQAHSNRPTKIPSRVHFAPRGKDSADYFIINTLYDLSSLRLRSQVSPKNLDAANRTEIADHMQDRIPQQRKFPNQSLALQREKVYWRVQEVSTAIQRFVPNRHPPQGPVSHSVPERHILPFAIHVTGYFETNSPERRPRGMAHGTFTANLAPIGMPASRSHLYRLMSSKFGSPTE